jgi:hypothetical protein
MRGDVGICSRPNEIGGKNNLRRFDVEILVCVRRVPDTSENEIELNRAGNDIERDELVYSINEADNYAVEEALQIVARTGGNRHGRHGWWRR